MPGEEVESRGTASEDQSSTSLHEAPERENSSSSIIGSSSYRPLSPSLCSSSSSSSLSSDGVSRRVRRLADRRAEEVVRATPDLWLLGVTMGVPGREMGVGAWLMFPVGGGSRGRVPGQVRSAEVM